MLAEIYLHLGVLLAGMASFLSPCVLPLVPPYLGYLGGTTTARMGETGALDRDQHRRIILGAVCFVLGFTTVFVGLGAGASAFGQLIQAWKGPLSIAAGLVITIFGLHFLGVLRISMLYTEARYHAEMERASLIGAYVLGLAFAFGWTPCVGPILATVLAVAANEGSLATGMRLLAVYSLGLGVPFILAAVAIGPFMGFMQRFKRHLGAVEHVMGAMLVLAGLLILAGPVHDMLREVAPGLLRGLTPLGTPLTLAGLALTLGLGGWLVRRTAGTVTARTEHSVMVAGVAAMALGLFVAGGSMNVIGQWMLDTFPGLASLEDWMTSRSLQGEIMRKGAGG
jgi:cytochrome c-type biogenesis protein